MPRFVLCVVIAMLAARPVWAGEHEFAVSVEGMLDDYREPSNVLNTRTPFPGIKGSYSFKEEYYFLKLEGRFSAGKGDYESVSGKVEDMPQREAEFRATGGINFRAGQNGVLSPFIGIGGRRYYDDSFGLVSSLGLRAYDRAISQIYVPVGVQWRMTGQSLRIDASAEYDHLLRGTVVSYLQEVGRSADARNIQRKGYGLRANIMAGPQMGRWQAGPFVRYWDIEDSNLFTAPDGSFSGREPQNTRLQTGVELVYRFTPWAAQNP